VKTWTVRKTQEQTKRQAEGQTVNDINSKERDLTSKQTGRKAGRPIYSQTDRDRPVGRRAERQTDKQIDRQKERQTYR